MIDGARRVAEAEHVGVGPAADFHRVEGDRVKRHPAHRLDVAEGNVGGGDAADAIGALRIQLHVVRDTAVAVGGGRRVGPGALGVAGVGEDVVDIEHREVRHLFLRHDADRRGQVVELRVEARAGHAVRREVATVVARGDFVRAQRDHVLGRLAGRRNSGHRDLGGFRLGFRRGGVGCGRRGFLCPDRRHRNHHHGCLHKDQPS
jgi:hypothetical protein